MWIVLAALGATVTIVATAIGAVKLVQRQRHRKSPGADAPAKAAQPQQFGSLRGSSSLQQEPSILPPPGPISIREPSSKARAIPEGEYARAFQLIDTNGDEELSKVEIMFACVKHEEVRELLGVTKENAQQALNDVWKEADADASGAITFDEFEPFINLLRGNSSSGLVGAFSSKATLAAREKGVRV